MLDKYDVLIPLFTNLIINRKFLKNVKLIWIKNTKISNNNLKNQEEKMSGKNKGSLLMQI